MNNNNAIERSLPNPSEDGVTHINAHITGVTKLGRYLSPPFQTSTTPTFHHPMLGSFRTVENLWLYLNTGGQDRMRYMAPGRARELAKLGKTFKCLQFRELLIDGVILHLRNNSSFEKMMIDSELPFDYYFFLKKKGQVPIRPNSAHIYTDVLETVRKILRGEVEHHFVQLSELKFEPRDKASED